MGHQAIVVETHCEIFVALEWNTIVVASDWNVLFTFVAEHWEVADTL